MENHFGEFILINIFKAKWIKHFIFRALLLFKYYNINKAKHV